jgi:hypothetical protein
MASNIIKERERQEALLYTFFFLVVFIVLMWLFPPSFDFSSTSVEETDRGSHLEIIKVLNSINFDKMSDFETAPKFEEQSGRSNPFSADRETVEQEVEEVGEVEETEEEIEEEETEEEEIEE